MFAATREDAPGRPAAAGTRRRQLSPRYSKLLRGGPGLQLISHSIKLFVYLFVYLSASFSSIYIHVCVCIHIYIHTFH